MVSNQEQQLGKYRVLRLLGRGGFADVYLGQHLYLKSYAALKVLRTSLEDEDVSQFITEAQTLARLAHLSASPCWLPHPNSYRPRKWRGQSPI